MFRGAGGVGRRDIRARAVEGGVMVDRLISFLMGASAAFLIWSVFALFGDASLFSRPIFWSIGCSLLAISAISYVRTHRLP